MTTTLNNDALRRTAICFADKALLLAESLTREDVLIGGVLIESSLEMATYAVEAEISEGKGYESRASGKISKTSCRCEAMLRLLKARGSIGDVTCASLLADVMKIRNAAAQPRPLQKTG